MAVFSNLTITGKGQALIAKMIAGTGNIEFTNVAASSDSYTDNQLEELDSLLNIKQTSAVSKIVRTDNAEVKVEASFTNTELAEGYYVKTVGLYAIDPDEGEILYAAARETTGGFYMPPFNGITVSGIYVQLMTAVGSIEGAPFEMEHLSNYEIDPDRRTYTAGFKSGFYDDTNNVVTYKNTNNTVACNKLPVHVPKGHIAIIDTKEFYVLTQFSGNNTVLGAAQVIVDGAATAGYLKSDYMVFPAHDYDVDLYFRVGNDKEHSTEISPENEDISVAVCKPKAAMIIQGNIFIYIANSMINIECSSTARSIVNGKFGTIQNTKTQLEKPTSGTFYICLNEGGFYLRNATFLTSVDYPIAYYYSDTIFSYGSDSVYCNTIPLTNWYQRENVPIFINNKKLNYTLDNRINQPYVDNFGYFYCVHNGYNYNGNLFYFSNDAGIKLTTDSVVKQNKVDISNKKILAVGDSVTRRGWYQQRIKEHVPSVEFVGTQTSYYNDIPCEGYSGRRAEHVLHDSTIQLTDGTTIANPFYNPASKVIDFDYYCTGNNIHPDYVIIEFGLNEISSVSYNTYIRNFINSIKAYDSSIVIYIVQPFGESDNAAFNRTTANQRRALNSCILESHKFTDCVKIPCYFIMVDEYDYEKTELDYGYNNVKVIGDADGVHPKEQTGFAKLGDMIYNWLGTN